MIFTERMIHLVAIVLERDSDAATKALLDEGVLDFVDLRRLPGTWNERIKTVKPRLAGSSLTELRKRIETIMVQADLTVDATSRLEVSRLSPVSLERTKEYLDSTNAELQEIRDQQKNIQDDVGRLSEMERQLTLFGDLGSTVRAQSRYSFLNLDAGSMPSAQLAPLQAALEGYPQVLLNYESTVEDRDRTSVLLISLRRDKSSITQILNRFEWQSIELGRDAPVTGELDSERALSEVRSKIERLTERQNELRGELRNRVMAKREELEEMWANLRMNELFSTIQSNFGRTDNTVLFSGWLPESKRDSLEESLHGAVGNRCYMEWSKPESVTRGSKELSIPVRLKNPRVLAPFQMLVENYAVPEYGTIDPTPLVVIAYLIMFGLMFADAGHGLILVITGILGMLLFRKREKRGLYNLSALVVWCGSASVVTGILVGSYFGMRWFNPIWIDLDALVMGHNPTRGYVTSIFGVLKITIIFGITVIGIGLVLNWINLINKRRWFKLCFDIGGLLGSWMYAGGIWVAWFYVRHDYRQLPDPAAIFLLLGIPALILLVKPPLEFLLKRREGGKRFGPFTIVDFLMGYVVELLEISTRYLSNTLSFMRVAGLGIAHVSLMIAFFDIARLAGGGGINIWSIAVLLFGNLLVLVLEGLSAGIQALRLNYYEFFSKFFSGTGKAYAPISLRARN